MIKRKMFPKVLGFIFSFFLSLFISHSSFAEVTTEKKVFENGLTLLVSRLPSNEVVSVYGLVKTGSATEGEFLGSGISHYLEHMLFKMTDHRAVGEIASQIQAVGGSINASTGKDYTIYTITVPLSAVDKAIEILSDMLLHTKFDPVEAEKERQVIFNEMRLHNDNPDSRLSDVMYSNIYIKHPYRHPIIGYPELLAKITPEDLNKYFKIHYAPNNTIISIAGDVTMDQIAPKITERFKEYERQMETPRNLAEEPAQLHSKYMEEEYPTDLTRFSVAYKSVSLLNTDLFALDVLANILGQGESSRLYRESLQNKKLVYGISSYNYTPIDQGIFGVEGVVTYSNLQPTLALIKSEIEKIKQKGVTSKELDKAKKQVESDYVFSNQTTSSVAYSRATDEAFTGDYNFSLNYIEGVKKVSLADIQRVANQYLQSDNETTTVLKPLGTVSSKESKESSFNTENIQKVVLKNGLTVLLKSDNHFPLISIQLAAKGGLRAEPSELNGLSKITSGLWVKGTKSKTSQQISELTESLGMSLSSFSGKNSFGLSLECLKEDFTQGFDLFEDVVKNPVFPDNEIAQAKTLMAAAIKERNDNVGQLTGKTMKELLFINHPYRMDEGGSEESLDKIKRDDIIKFYQNYLQPTNLVLSVMGDFDSKEVLEIIKKKFESLPEQNVSIQDVSENPIDAPRIKSITMNKEQAMVMIGFHAPMMGSSERYGVEVLTNILGSSFSGRLFSSIREKLGKAYTLGGSYVPGLDTGFVYFYVLTTNENVDKVVELLKSEITRIQQEPVSDQELTDIKTYLKGNQKDDLQTNSALNFMVSLDELYGLGYNLYKDYDRNIDAVTKEDVNRLAKTYLDLNKYVLVTTLSQGTTNEQK